MTVLHESQLFEISTVARELGVSADTIRAWERRKMITPPRRTASGTRLYTEADVEAMRQAQQARETGSRTLLEAA